MTFRVGQKVVCVDDSPSDVTGERPFKQGLIYIVDGIDTHPLGGLFLQGIRRTRLVVYRDGTPAGWRRDRFRPLVERKTDTGMAILRKLLNTKQHADLLPQE